jgi:mono/diheme cytochrome c family protein
MRYRIGLLFLLITHSLSSAETVAFFRFSAEETSKLEPHGSVHRDQPGPRSPEFPDFDKGNLAIKLDGQGSYFRLADPGENSSFDFTNGNSITLEAFVKMSDIKAGENLYIIGKGRTHEKGFPKDNQNWALRVRELNGSVRVSFLFFSSGTKEKPGQYHRWTSEEGFKTTGQWHHIAVGYEFGKPESIKGWLDGKRVSGKWDMGGATTQAPVVDNDAIWIGSAQGGSAGNSFRGWLDEIGIHRTILSDETISKRYKTTATPVVIRPDTYLAPEKRIPGKVHLSFHEGWEAFDGFPSDVNLLPPAVVNFETERFALTRMPTRYDDWGIRAAWKPTVLMRGSAEVLLPAGKHRFLLRGRNMSRLWIDGKLVGKTGALKPGEDGHGKVPPEPKQHAENCRLLEYGDLEGVFEFTVSEGRHLLLWESLFGGKKFRVETGESCVAVQLEGDSSFRFVSPGQDQPPFTDDNWRSFAQAQERSLDRFDQQSRQQAAASEQSYWQKRHDHARKWAETHPAPMVPEVAAKYGVNNEIDRFIAAKIESGLKSNQLDTAGKEFHEKILPLLQQNCFRCHGEKERGGLKLNSRDAALKHGESGKVSIVPNHPEKSELIARIKSSGEERMPTNGEPLKAEQIQLLETWIKAGAKWPSPPLRESDLTPSLLTSDAAFLRRIYLDTVGVLPTPEEAKEFLQDRSKDKRTQLISRLLDDPRFADHWVSYWQDVLAENPNLVKPSLNNSGPFRFFLHEALRDNRPYDRFVTELVMMRGSLTDGGSAGFAIAADNDAPFAAKAHILSTAFQGVEMQCARCHDSPYHSTKQRDLFNLAAMLERKPITIPKTSSVPKEFFDKKVRQSLIQVSSKPGEVMQPKWPFSQISPAEVPAEWLRTATDSREKLAVIITLPENQRFAKVLVNRFWKRLLGAGIVEPAHDWEGREASHPQLLDWLAHQFVAHDYDAKYLLKLILNSQTYQRESGGNNLKSSADKRYFASPERRRMSGEQVVDSLVHARGNWLPSEALSFDRNGGMTSDRFLSLGVPQRAWEFLSLSNERDRPSLALPRAQAVVDVLEAFGWNGARQSPLTDRETDPNVLQPGILANGVFSIHMSRLSDGTRYTRLALESDTLETLADSIYLTVLSRLPTEKEKAAVVKQLTPGFAERKLESSTKSGPIRQPRVSWANHLNDLANQQMLDYAKLLREGDPPTQRLNTEWRERMEDVVWSLFNLPEFVWVP